MEISEIKSKLTITQVLDYYNITTDRNNRICCPWHNDKSPSLQIYPKTNSWTCFSTNCDAGSGDVIDFIMKYEQVSKHEALLKATSLITGNPAAINRASEIKPRNHMRAESQELSRKAVLAKYFQSTLRSIGNNKRAKEYLESRNLLREKLSVGYCSNTIASKWNKHLKQSAENMGLLKIKHCIVFPIKNKEGQIESVYGRSVVNDGSSRHFYLSGGFKGLYPGYPKQETKILILTESIIDAASVYQYKEKLGSDTSVLACYGANGWTDDHEEAVRELQGLEEVILFYDGDEAGRKAVDKYTKLLGELRPRIKISQVITPEGEDPNSLLESHDSEIFTHLIEKREKVQTSNFLFSSEKQLNGTNPGHQSGQYPNNSQPEPATLQRGLPGPKLNTDNPELILYETPELHITILGGIKITGLDKMRVTLKLRVRKSITCPET